MDQEDGCIVQCRKNPAHLFVAKAGSFLSEKSQRYVTRGRDPVVTIKPAMCPICIEKRRKKAGRIIHDMTLYRRPAEIALIANELGIAVSAIGSLADSPFQGDLVPLGESLPILV